MFFWRKKITAEQLKYQQINSKYRQTRELELKRWEKWRRLVNENFLKEGIVSAKFGLSCTIKELYRFQRAVPFLLGFREWRDNGQQQDAQVFQPSHELRHIAHSTVSAINLTVGVTNKNKLIVDESRRGFYAELSHQHLTISKIFRLSYIEPKPVRDTLLYVFVFKKIEKRQI